MDRTGLRILITNKRKKLPDVEFDVIFEIRLMH